MFQEFLIQQSIRRCTSYEELFTIFARQVSKETKLLFSIFASADSRCLFQLYWKPIVVRQLVGIDM